MESLAALRRLPIEMHLVDGKRLQRFPGHIHRHHLERMNDAQLGLRDPFQQPRLVELVHEKADGAAVHAIDRHTGSHEAVQRLQHEAVAAERDDGIRPFGLDRAIALGKAFQGALRFGRGACNESNANFIRQGACPGANRAYVCHNVSPALVAA